LDAHIVDVSGKEAFAREVGFTSYGLTKDKSFDLLMAKRARTNIDLIPGIGELIRRCASRVAGKKHHNGPWKSAVCYYHNKQIPSYVMVGRLIALMPPCPERDELSAVAIQHHAWSAVESITTSHAHRMSCEVTDGHAFVGNGIVSLCGA
jgi:hypothetical protein